MLIPIPVYKKTFVHSPGGASARGPWGPKAIHQAVESSVRALCLRVFIGPRARDQGFAVSWSRPEAQTKSRLGVIHTSFLFLQCQLIPIHLHTISQLHPQLGLILWWQSFPSLLDSGQGRVGDGMGGSSMRLACDRGLMQGSERWS